MKLKAINFFDWIFYLNVEFIGSMLGQLDPPQTSQSAQKTPEMKRSRRVHIRRYFIFSQLLLRKKLQPFKNSVEHGDANRFPAAKG